MSWYLVLRALCILAFIAGFCCLIGAGCMLEEGKRSSAIRWTYAGFAFALAGCLLIGLGWTPVHA